MKYLIILFFLPLMSFAQGKISATDIGLSLKIHKKARGQVKMFIKNNSVKSYKLKKKSRSGKTSLQYSSYWTKAQVMEYLTMNPLIEIA